MFRYEIGPLLGRGHEAIGLMSATLTISTWRGVNRACDADASSLAADALFALLTTEEETV